MKAGRCVPAKWGRNRGKAWNADIRGHPRKEKQKPREGTSQTWLPPAHKKIIQEVWDVWFSSKLLNRHFIKSCRIWKGAAVSKKSKLQEIKEFKKTVIVYLLAGQWVAFLGWSWGKFWAWVMLGMEGKCWGPSPLICHYTINVSRHTWGRGGGGPGGGM